MVDAENTASSFVTYGLAALRLSRTLTDRSFANMAPTGLVPVSG
jgi:hypothetical protein